MTADEKTLAAMQPYLFPYLGYWSLLLQADKFVVLDDVQMITRGWINRNNILLSDSPHRFTISLVNSSQSRLISEVEVGDDFRSFRKLLASAYAKAPFFQQTMDVLEGVLSFADRNLARFVENSLRVLADHLGIATPMIRSSTIPIASGLRAQDKIIALCRADKATRYVNPIGGTSLYSNAAFAEQGIELKFLRHDALPYPQHGRSFTPNLSIIDALMSVGPRGCRPLIESYALVDAQAEGS